MDLDLQETVNAFKDDENMEWGYNINNYNNQIINDTSTTNEEGLTNEHIRILQENFGHDSFRPMQWSIIRTVLEEKRDQCVVMATGYGKSLCFQYPAVYTGGITVVISPLISLMEDQVMSLQIAGIPACFLGSAQSKRNIVNDIFDNMFRLVYLTPEFCTGDYGLEILQKMNSKLNITLIAIDEAHCVSQWGHDFRYSYKNLGNLKNILKNVPILAVTATATEDVVVDVCKMLCLKNPKKTCSGFDRPNLYFEVRQKNTKNIAANIMSYLQNIDEGSVIIYTLTKKETTNISEILKLQGIHCEQYHAGLPLSKRKQVHEDFSSDKIKIIVATIAFGMGIDKPDVRLIVHYGASKDMESYYQEVGRAGRDGLPSKCVTFFSPADFLTHNLVRQQNYTSQELIKRHEKITAFMKKYLYTTNCRRELILQYFQNSKENTQKQVKPENCCDNCKNRKTKNVSDIQYEDLDNCGLFDFTQFIKLMLDVIVALDGKFGLNMYISFLKGSCIAKMKMSFRKHPLFGAGNKHTTEWWKAIGRIAEEQGFIKKNKIDNYCVYTLMLSPKGRNFLEDLKSSKQISIKAEPPTDIIKYLKKKIIHPQEIYKTETSQTSTSNELSKSTLSLYHENDPKDMKDFNYKLYVHLRKFRNQLGHEIDCSPYMIATDVAIIEIVRALPKTVDEFSSCHFSTFNQTKVQKFASRFIEFINTFLLENEVPKSLKKMLPKDFICNQSPEKMKRNLDQFSFQSNKKERSVKKSAIFDLSSDEEDECTMEQSNKTIENNNIQCSDKKIDDQKVDNIKNEQNQESKHDISFSDDCNDDDIEMAAALDFIENQNEKKYEELECFSDDSPPRTVNLKRSIINQTGECSTSQILNKMSRY